MSYAVITFEEDGKVCAVPASWFIGGKVHLPPLTGRNLRGAIKQAIPKQDTWEGYSASLVIPAETYELASAIGQKLSTQDEESDTSPCRGIPQKRRPRPVRRYTPNPTDEEYQYTEIQGELPVLNSTVISPVAGTSTATAVKYPALRPVSLCENASPGLNLSLLEEKGSSQPGLHHNKGFEATLLAALESLKEDVKSIRDEMKCEFRDIVARIENLDMHVGALDVQVNNYHNDVLKKSCTESPTKPRWRPWFPLKTITELSAMEDNLQNENCRADVVNLIQRTPTSNMTERTKCCLARLISEDLSKELSWQKTPNRQPFGSTSLWAVVLETLSSSSNDQDCGFVAIRKACMGWFQNARDRCGGRSKRRMTMPKMPQLEKNNENVSEELGNVQTSESYMSIP